MEKAGGPVKAACATPCNPPNRRAMDAKTERDRRLAEALRANLRRRKEQARGKDSESPPSSTDSPDGESSTHSS